LHAFIVAAAATDGGEHARKIVAPTPLPTPTMTPMTTEIVFLLRDLNRAAGCRRRQPPLSGATTIIVATKPFAAAATNLIIVTL